MNPHPRRFSRPVHLLLSSVCLLGFLLSTAPPASATTVAASDRSLSAPFPQPVEAVPDDPFAFQTLSVPNSLVLEPAPAQEGSDTVLPEPPPDEPPVEIPLAPPLDLRPPASIHLLSSGLLPPGGQLEVTAVVQADLEVDAPVEGLRLALTLPPELVLVAGPADSALPPLPAGAAVTQTWTLQTAPALAEAATLALDISLSRTGAYPLRQQLWVGVTDGLTAGAPDGTTPEARQIVSATVGAAGTVLQLPSAPVNVLVPEGAAPAGALLALQMLYDGQAEQQSQAAVPDAAPAAEEAGSADTPPLEPTPTPTASPTPTETPPESADSLFFPDAGLPSHVDSGVNFFAQWALTAQTPDGAPQPLDAPVLLRVDVTWLGLRRAGRANSPPRSLRATKEWQFGIRSSPLAHFRCGRGAR